jgi:hypothetical protein
VMVSPVMALELKRLLKAFTSVRRLRDGKTNTRLRFGYKREEVRGSRFEVGRRVRGGFDCDAWPPGNHLKP